MDIRKIIQEELRKVLEGVGSDYYNRFPDFIDTQFNPQMGKYPPKGMHAYGQVFKEDSLEEGYPEMFKMEEFKTLTTFKERIRYCEAFLQRISSGSSRIVYRVDDKMVLKLAKNKKGIAQNELEAESSKYSDLEGLVAKVYEYDEEFLWVEMELARKMSKGDFERITGFSFDDYSKVVHNHGTDTVSPRTSKVEGPSEEMVGLMWEDDFISSIFQYMPDYDVPSRDLMRTSSYGIVNREWGEDVVLVDYGFNKDIHTNYYS
jgi:hypothetical protein